MKLKITHNSEGRTYYGHGKLLITSEYFVLDGAQALAVPTKFGQSMRVKELHASDSTLYWIALNSKKQPWLNLVFDTNNLTCINAQTPEAERLSNMLVEARKLNPLFLTEGKDTAVETQLEFPNEWGLGTSSTLIYCLAQWAEVDPYKLLKNTIGGSGYDLACAAHDTPILYRLDDGFPKTLPIQWNPSFSNNIYFAYLGKKQLSSEAIKYYKENIEDKSDTAADLTDVTKWILKCKDLEMFEDLISEHESIIAEELNLTRIQDALFSDYWGSVKSLGAWGGDFVMLTNDRSEEEIKTYLNNKGIETIFRWDELIIPQA